MEKMEPGSDNEPDLSVKTSVAKQFKIQHINHEMKKSVILTILSFMKLSFQMIKILDFNVPSTAQPQAYLRMINFCHKQVHILKFHVIYIIIK